MHSLEDLGIGGVMEFGRVPENELNKVDIRLPEAPLYNKKVWREIKRENYLIDRSWERIVNGQARIYVARDMCLLYNRSIQLITNY